MTRCYVLLAVAGCCSHQTTNLGVASSNLAGRTLFSPSLVRDRSVADELRYPTHAGGGDAQSRRYFISMGGCFYPHGGQTITVNSIV